MILRGGASGRTRTDTWLPIPDFESGASTSFTTEAKKAVILAKFSLSLAYLLELFLDFKKNILLAEAIIKAQKERDKLTNITINEVNSTFKECFLKYCRHKKMH